MVFTTYLPTLLSTYYYLLAPYVFIEVHTMKKKYIVPCHSIWGSPIHMLELVPEHDPSIEEKHKTTTYNSDNIVMIDYLYLRLCMKNLSGLGVIGSEAVLDRHR